MNPSERGITPQSEGITRRYFLLGAAAAALGLTGCVEEDPSDRTEKGLQVDEDAAQFIFGWYFLLLGSIVAPLLWSRWRQKPNNPPPSPPIPNNES